MKDMYVFIWNPRKEYYEDDVEDLYFELVKLVKLLVSKKMISKKYIKIVESMEVNFAKYELESNFFFNNLNNYKPLATLVQIYLDTYVKRYNHATR